MGVGRGVGRVWDALQPKPRRGLRAIKRAGKWEGKRAGKWEGKRAGKWEGGADPRRFRALEFGPRG